MSCLTRKPRRPGDLLYIPILAVLIGAASPGVSQELTAPFPRNGEYSGPDRCIECHDVEAASIADNAHRDLVRSELLPGCETCHGPGKDHSDDIATEPTKITYPPELNAADQGRLCGRCHGPEIDHHRGDPLGFLAAGLGCTNCHAIHPGRVATAPKLRAQRKTDLDAKAEPVGAKRCVECHPIRDQRLAESPHRSLAAAQAGDGCENCHGHGSLHAEHQLARLITRPDQARDGIETCRSCHQEVDAEQFHWIDRHRPLLSADLTCSSCHPVHDAENSATVNAPTNALCAGCHAPAMPLLEGSIHAQLGGLDTPLERGCGGCHPGAAEHAAGPGRPDSITALRSPDAEVQQQLCTSCHANEPALRHAATGSHQRSGVGCLACHSPIARAGGVRADAEKSCKNCHAPVMAEFRQPNHHPVESGRMSCSDCHEPHAARHRLRDVELQERRCVECHREYRGPFVFAHQASRQNGCITCHSPHGSSNQRMLRAATPGQSCLACHADFPAFHDQTVGAIYRDCLRCHSQVHGSNHSRFLLR